MALFKFRKSGGDEPAAASAQPESVESLRRRARHRLIGASVLVLLGVVGFPLLFDTQPRPIAVDIPIEIPDRNKVKPLAAPARVVAQAPVAAGAGASAPVAQAPAPAPVAVPSAPKAAEPVIVAKAQPQVEAKPEPKPEAKVEAKPTARPADGDRAKALLEGKAVQASEGRFVVQVGAFSDTAKAREARMKVERSGIKTLVQVVETKDGPRTRVRVGPFPNRAEAEKAAEKIKGLDLPAAILTL
jgi:DedD protein